MDRPVPPLTLLQTHTPAQLLKAPSLTDPQQLDVNANNASPPDPMQWEEGEQLLAAVGEDREEVGTNSGCGPCLFRIVSA